MLKGKEFGQAIDKAITLKISSGGARSKAEIARHFDVRPPSLVDWVKKGSIAKERLPALWAYFADVVGPQHWGLTENEWPSGLSARMRNEDAQAVRNSVHWWPFSKSTPERVHALTAQQRQKLDDMIDAVLKGFEADRD
ncbi:hypothetical protein [Castellaniella sp. UC4442_H9]